MTVRIRTEDGACGKSITAKRKKINGTDQTVCSLKVQMAVNRREFEQLAGFPDRYCDHFYTEEGMPVANISLLLTKRELDVNGTITAAGDDDKPRDCLPVKMATASDMRFVPEPNTAVFICKLSWIAAGDEVEEVKDLLGCFCNIDLKFTTPPEQKPLDYSKKTDEEQAKLAEGLRAVQDQLKVIGVKIPKDHAIWSTLTAAELKRITAFVVKSKDGKKVQLPAVLKPLFKRDDRVLN